MKFIVATRNKDYMTKISDTFFDTKHEVSFLSNREKIRSVFKKIYSHHQVYNLREDHNYLIMVDEHFYQEFFFEKFASNDGVINFVVVILTDNLSQIKIENVLDSWVSLLIPMKKTTKKELLLHIQLLIANYFKVKQLQSYAFMDPLTKIRNRRTFILGLEHYFTLFYKYNTPFCLGIIDLDHFKSINDTYGHVKGDEILEKVSQIMSSNCRKTDILARIGGEEFGIVFPNTTLNRAYYVLDRIRVKVHDSIKMKENLEITLSAGVCLPQKEYKDYHDMLKSADSLLYKAKALGRNQVSQ